MAIRHPKPRQIRLPFAVPRPDSGAEVPVRACGICKAKDSRYTCPRCNVPYCSLACFRSESHAQCSEPFYKATVVDQIALDPEAAAGEKRRMMDMLRRFEEAHAGGEDLAALVDEDGEGDGDELAAALEGVDLDSIDSNTLLRLLPPAHRDAFLATIQDPNSAEAKELLEAAVEGGVGDDEILPAPTVLPWWEADELNDEEQGSFAPPPPAVDTGSLKPPIAVASKLVYNLVAVCMAYCHTLLSLRLPSLAPEYITQQDLSPDEVAHELATLVPFLFAPTSTVRHESARAAWGAVWEAMGPDAGDSQTLAYLLDKVASLLHPPITTEPPRAMGVLDDLYRFLEGRGGTAQAQAQAKKVVFYAAAMGQVSRGEWLRLEGEVRREAEGVRSEAGGAEEETGERAVPLVERGVGAPPASGSTAGAKIELLE